MWKRTITAAAVGLGLCLSACATYQAPAGVPTARITTASGPGAASGVAISYASADFERDETFKGYSFYTYGVEGSLPAETTAYIRVTGHISTYFTEYYCDSYFSFLPREGRRYVVRNEMISQGCRSWVVDESGAIAEGFRPESGPAEH